VAGSRGVARRSVDLAVLLPIADDRRPFSAVRLRPAVDLAVSHVSAVFSCRLRVSYRDSQCSEVYGMNEAINYFMRSPPDVYFGPICDYAVAPVARQSPVWDIPVVSVGALARNFFVEHRAKYPLLTRAGPVNLVGLADTIFEAMHMHAWRRVVVLYERQGRSEVIPPFCHLATETFVYYPLESATSQRVSKKEHYNLDLDPAKINFAEVLANEVGHKFAGT